MQTSEINTGQRVHCILYGGKDGTVVKIHGKQSPSTCHDLGGIGVTGGSAEFDIVWDNGTKSNMIPESLLRSSVQWRIYDEVVDEVAVAAAITYSAVTYAAATAKAAIEANAFAAETEQCRIKNPHLKQHSDIEGAFDRAKSNIRIELKRTWPKIKFSVRSEHYGSVRICWKDGPTSKQVEMLVSKYRAGHFDGQEDIYRNTNTPWNTVFGDAKYISVDRDYSPDLLSICLDKLYQALSSNLKDVPRPSVDFLNGYGEAPAIPEINMDVREGTRAIAEAYDSTTGQVGYEGYYRHAWLIDLLQEQHTEPSAAPA